MRHANGVDWIQRADPDGMQRSSRIHTSGASSELYTGEYGFDGVGNVMRTGDVTLRAEGPVVLRDGFSVTDGGTLTVDAGAAVNDSPPSEVTRTQSYAYDRFGNRTETTTDGVTRTLQVDSSTNRMSSSLFSYDASGNLVTQTTASTIWDYHIDPFDMLREARHRGGNGFTFVYGPGDERIWTVDWTDGPETSAWKSVYTLRGLDGAVLRRFRVEGGNAEGNWLELRDTPAAHPPFDGELRARLQGPVGHQGEQHPLDVVAGGALGQ